MEARTVDKFGIDIFNVIQKGYNRILENKKPCIRFKRWAKWVVKYAEEGEEYNNNYLKLAVEAIRK